MNYSHAIKYQTQTSSKNKKRFAKSSDLEKLCYSIFDNHIAGLSNKSRAMLSLIICLVKIGYNGLNAPVDAIVQSLKRSTGYTASKRTVFRALAELESKGFFERKKYRVGSNRFSTVITFHVDAFSFWTRKKHDNISPMTTVCDNTVQVTNWRKDLGTSTISYVNSRNNNIYNKPRARASRSYSRWLHPIVFTLGLLLKGDEKKLAVSRANLELQIGPQMEGHSGVPWEAWPRWQEMDRGARENIAKSEIIPRLLDRSTLRRSEEAQNIPFPIGDLYSATIVDPEREQRSSPPQSPPMTTAEISAAIASFSAKAENEERLCSKNRNTREKISLDNNDLQILAEARARARARAL